jgi:anti-sigma B factor antagonist
MSSNDRLVSFRHDGPVRVGTVHASAVVDIDSMRDFGETVVRYVHSRPGLWLLLNFEHVQFLSSAAITELIRINEAIQKAGGHLQICGLSKDIQKLFKLTNMHKLLPLNTKDTPEKALNRFQRAATVAQQELDYRKRK